MYLTYDEYTDYGGELDETIFDDLVVRADGIVNRYTFNRFTSDTEYPDELKRLIYRLIRLLTLNDNVVGLDTTGEGSIGTGSVASQSNDGVSISYNNLGATDLYNLTGNTGTTIKDTIKTYLYGVKNQAGHLVLYKGLYENE